MRAILSTGLLVLRAVQRRGAVRAIGGVAALLVGTPCIAAGATYYISPSGSNSSSCAAAQSSATPRQTLAGGASCLAAGDTLVLRNGTYSGPANRFSNLPNGASGTYVTIRAENDSGAIVTAGLSMDHADAYIQIIGLRFHDGDEKHIVGRHLKFLRCEFRGGPDTGSGAGTSIGTNDHDDTADILIEDSWSHGSGGRYNFLVYNADRVVLRRVVVRHDGGYTEAGGNPEAGFSFYNSADSHCQNCIVIDSTLHSYVYWQGAFYVVENWSVSHANTNNSWTGVIALNNKDLGMRMDSSSGATISNATITDSIFWDNENGGIAMCCSTVTGINVNRVTIGRSKVSNSGDFRGGLGSFASGTQSAANVIIHGLEGADIQGVSITHFDSHANGRTAAGTGRQTYNPLQNGLLYLPRIEAGSALKTAGSSGGQIGAQIVNRIGAAGTFKGESGWNSDTGVALWPWPNEGRIKKEMCADVGITRGFCGDSSLTNYIWNYLGNGNPNRSASPIPAAPTRLRIIP